MKNIIKKIKRYVVADNFEPLKITFNMQTPVMLGHPFIHLDGLVLHLTYRDALGDDYYCLPSKKPLDFSSYVQPPLKKTGSVYNASVSFFDTDTKFATTIYKRFCTEYLDLLKTKKQKITRGVGFFRDYMMKMIYVPSKNIYFYANADKDELERLLHHVVSLGKKTAYGFGKVKSVNVENIYSDHSIVSNNKAMRPIPVNMLRYAETKILLAYKPPYWDKNNVGLCAFPQTEAKLEENLA